MLVPFAFTAYSDIHYDEYGFSGVDSETKKNNRLLDIASADRQITEYAFEVLENTPDYFVVFLGDRFRKRNPQGYIRDLADQEMKRRAQLGVPQMILPGNHDFYEKSRYKGHSYGVSEIFKNELPGVVIMSEPRTYESPNPGVLFHALPSGFTMEDASFNPDKSKTNILVLHDMLSGSIIDARTGRTQASSMSLASIDLDVFDFVLAGDIHVPQELKLSKTRGWYLGSTVQINRGEVGPRGWWAFSSDGQGLNYERFMPDVPMLQSFKGTLEAAQSWLNNPGDDDQGPLPEDYKWVTIVGNHSPKEKQKIRKRLKEVYGFMGRLYIAFEPIIERSESKMELKPGTSPVENWKSFVGKSDLEGLDKELVTVRGSDILMEVSHAGV